MNTASIARPDLSAVETQLRDTGNFKAGVGWVRAWKSAGNGPGPLVECRGVSHGSSPAEQMV